MSLITPTQDQLKLINQRVQEASQDIEVWFDRFLFTFNPKQAPYDFPFKLFDYQRPLVHELVQAIDRGYDVFVDKAREMGVTYVTLGVFLWFWRFRVGSNFLLGSRKQDYVDNTKGEAGEVSNKEESLFGKLEYMLKHMLPQALPNGFDPKKHLTFMSLVNPELGNVVSGESSNANFSRGGRQKAILLDEFAFWENDVSAWGSTADTTNCRIVVTTAGNRPCKAKRLRFGKDGENIKVLELDYKLDPRKNEDWERKERSRRSSEDFAREILRNWETSITGRVYDEIQLATMGKFPYVPDWPLYNSWDFGLDGTSIGWWQISPQTGKSRLVESYHKDNVPIQYFFPLFNMPIDSLFTYTAEDVALFERIKNWKRGIHYGDPDVAKRSYIDKETITTRQVLQNAGIYIQTKPESNTFYVRREKTKLLLQRGIEINDTPNNDYYLEAMKQARYPQRDEGSQATTAVNLPIHDWTSHPRTMTEYYAVNIFKDENTLERQGSYQAYVQRNKTPRDSELGF